MATAYSVTEQFVMWLASLGYTSSTYPAADAIPPFVTVERVGGGVIDTVDRPQMAIQAWAATEAEAEALATEIRNRVLLGSKPYGVLSAFINAGPYPFWDESTRLPRYQLVLDCTAIIE